MNRISAVEVGSTQSLVCKRVQKAASGKGSAPGPLSPPTYRNKSWVCQAQSKKINAAKVDDIGVSTAQAEGGNPRLTPETWTSFLGAYKTSNEERLMAVTAEMVEGDIPKELKGTLLRNGPGMFEIGGKPIPQPFDGDGKVAMVCFDGEKGELPYFATRFVRTSAFVEEQLEDKMIYRGAFSVGNPAGGLFYNPFDLNVKQVANTGVLYWAHKVLALYERDLPYHLESPDLKTVGKTDFGGQIDEPYFAAHHRIVEEADGSKRLIGFCSSESGLDNNLVIWEFDKDGKQLHKVDKLIKNAAFGFFHDMAVTEMHYIFVENPIRLDLKKFLLEYLFGKACIAECLMFDRSMDTKIHVIPRPGKGNESECKVFICPEPFFTFHHANAFTTSHGNIVLDTCALGEGMDFSVNLSTGVSYYNDNVGRSALTRIFIDMATGKVSQTKLMNRAADFPSVSPNHTAKPHQHIYVYGSLADSEEEWGPPQVVSKVSLQEDEVETKAPSVTQKVYMPGKDRWAGEPIFVPRKNAKEEDDGWVLVLVYDHMEDRSDLVILDGESMQVQATIKFPFMIPAGLHGSFTSEVLRPNDLDEFIPPTTYDIRMGVLQYK
eukprot:jgi/Picsp_1/4408/NSC_01914-R1_carotenoid oxygenase